MATKPKNPAATAAKAPPKAPARPKQPTAAPGNATPQEQPQTQDPDGAPAANPARPVVVGSYTEPDAVLLSMSPALYARLAATVERYLPRSPSPIRITDLEPLSPPDALALPSLTDRGLDLLLETLSMYGGMITQLQEQADSAQSNRIKVEHLRTQLEHRTQQLLAVIDQFNRPTTPPKTSTLDLAARAILNVATFDVVGFLRELNANPLVQIAAQHPAMSSFISKLVPSASQLADEEALDTTQPVPEPEATVGTPSLVSEQYERNENGGNRPAPAEESDEVIVAQTIVDLPPAAPESAQTPAPEKPTVYVNHDNLPSTSATAARLHQAYVQQMNATGNRTAVNQDGEDVLLPYESLSERAQGHIRQRVEAVYAALIAAATQPGAVAEGAPSSSLNTSDTVQDDLLDETPATPPVGELLPTNVPEDEQDNTETESSPDADPALTAAPQGTADENSENGDTEPIHTGTDQAPVEVAASPETTPVEATSTAEGSATQDAAPATVITTSELEQDGDDALRPASVVSTAPESTEEAAPDSADDAPEQPLAQDDAVVTPADPTPAPVATPEEENFARLSPGDNA